MAPTPRTRRITGDIDDSPALGQAPRLSLAFRDLEDDSFHEAAPGRPSYPLENEDSEIETRRRAFLGRDRQSFGDLGDPSFADMNELGQGNMEDITERRKLFDQDMTMDIDDVDAE